MKTKGKKYKTYCDKCGLEIVDNFDDHLHGDNFLMTYMPDLKVSDFVVKKPQRIVRKTNPHVAFKKGKL